MGSAMAMSAGEQHRVASQARDVQRQTEGQLQETLLVMDVVDEMRHRAAELDKINATDDAALKARLAEIYRQQGIEVSDAVLEEAIQAQRDKRFVHVAPKGPAVAVAKLWIQRRRVSLVAGICLSAMGLWHVAVTMPHEAAIVRQIAAVNEWTSGLRSHVSGQQGTLAKAKEQVLEAKRAAESVANADRLRGVIQAEVAAAAKSESDALKGLAELQVAPGPKLERAEYETRYASLQARVQAEQEKGKAIDLAIAALYGAAERIRAATGLSVSLDAANDQVVALALAPERDAVRAKLYASGVAGILAGQANVARTSAAALSDLTQVFGEMAALKERAAALRDAGQKTTPDAEGAGALEAAYARMSAALEAVDPARGLGALVDARKAESQLTTLVALLSGEYVYRVVNREGVKSGVWRYNTQTPNAKNYYLVVEAVNSSGQVDPVEVLNEETGKTEPARLFAVRVSEAAYEKVKADKMDNGLVDRAEIGRKARGHLRPTFSVDVTGGYITSW